MVWDDLGIALGWFVMVCNGIGCFFCMVCGALGLLGWFGDRFCFVCVWFGLVWDGFGMVLGWFGMVVMVWDDFGMVWDGLIDAFI